MEKQVIDNLQKYGSEFQIKCIASLLVDKPFLERIYDIIETNYFESDAHKWIVSEITSYFLQYKELPTMTVFKIRIDSIQQPDLKNGVVTQLRNVYVKISDADIKYVQATFLEFCRNQKMKKAVYDSVDLISSGQYEQIKVKFDEALKAGMERNLGHDYFEDVDKRLSDIARNCIKTGWGMVDTLLDGGLAPGELGVIISSAGGGKSWCLAGLGKEAMFQGKNIIHYTLELNENYVGRRYDACFTGFDFQAIPKNKEIVKRRVEDMKSQTGFGKLKIKYFPTKTISAASLKAHIERYQTVESTKVDMIIVDYADLLKPFLNDASANSYNSAGSIYEELRTVAGELQIPIWTASQGNRSSAEEDIITANNVADSYRKIMTADFVISLSRKVEDKVSNTARFHVIKNRFGSDGVTFPSIFNSSNGSIAMFDSTSKEGMELQEKMGDGENVVKKMLSDKWNKHSNPEETEASE